MSSINEDSNKLKSFDLDQLLKNLNNKIEVLKNNFEELKIIHEFTIDKIKKEKANNEKIVETCKKYPAVDSDIIRLNIGGTLFSTLKSTLTKKILNSITGDYYETNLLESLVSGYVKAKYDENKALFIDRNAKYFSFILDYLRDANTEIIFSLPTSLDLNEFKREVQYYNIQGLMNLCNPKYKLLDSTILLNYNQQEELRTLCEFDKLDNWNLLYRASRDGFDTRTFHSKCDYIPNTLTIVKSSNGNVFGGFASVQWDQSYSWKSDINCFIFSLINKDNKPIKMKFYSGNAIYCYSSYGPTFGNGLDLCIGEGSFSCQTGRSNLGSSFKHPSYTDGSSKANSFLAGSNSFQISEIEVFQVKLKKNLTEFNEELREII